MRVRPEVSEVGRKTISGDASPLHPSPSGVHRSLELADAPQMALERLEREFLGLTPSQRLLLTIGQANDASAKDIASWRG